MQYSSTDTIPFVVAKLAGVPTSIGSTLQYTDGGNVVTGTVSVVRAIARVNGSLGGSDSSSIAEVDEWLESLASNGVGFTLAALNKALAHRTYAAGYSLTIADVVLYVSTLVYGRPSDESDGFRRWVDLCDSRLGISQAVSATRAVDASTLSAFTAASSGRKEIPTSSLSFPSPSSSSSSSASSSNSSSASSSNSASSGAGADAAAAVKVSKGKPTAEEMERKLAEKRAKNAPPPPAAAGGGSGGGGGGTPAAVLPPLPEAEMGKVVTRFPPEPSGYMHIGHVKACMINNEYAKMYGGKMLVRFDDTNPSKEKDEYELAIMSDLKKLGIVYACVSHTSDYFDVIEVYARKLITDGKAYMDDTDQATMRIERSTLPNGIESKRRNESIADNTARFELMLKGGKEAEPWCMRAKMDMADPNGTMRDPVLFRGNDTPHHRTKSRYKAYPTYDLANPIVDSLEGVTHCLRSSEYHDRDKQYYALQDMMGLRRVIIQDFARLNFVYCLLSKRKLTKFVEDKKVEGWNDARFPTVQGIIRRGMTVPALREFILAQGASRKDVECEWDKFWAINKKHVDPVAARYTAIPADNIIRVVISDGPETPEIRSQPLHPKNPDVGVKPVTYTKTILLDVVDVAAIADGEEVTLMKWGNAIIDKVTKDAKGRPTSATAHLNLAGDVKSTSKKLTWLPETDSLLSFTLCEFDYLIKTPNLDEFADFAAAENPVTKLDTKMLGEPAMRLIKADEIIQVERLAFCRCDRPYMDEARPGVIYQIPDGKVKGLFNLAEKKALREKKD